MKIVHCIASLDKDRGGPSRSVPWTIEELLKLEEINSVELLALRSDEPAIQKFSSPKGEILFFRKGCLEYSLELKRYLKSNEADLYHGQGIWNLPIHILAKEARSQKKPYVISIRGMLEEWSLKQSRLKKKLALLLYQNYDLKHASCIHVTSQMEANSVRRLGYTQPIALIPNGINLSEYSFKSKTEKADKKVLFLSRIHKKKGIEVLIDAWSSLPSNLKSEWSLEIVGNGEKEYINTLNNLAQEKGISKNFQISPAAYGDDKFDKYYSADIFVLPSYSENFGNVIGEALACGTPVITTQGTPWEIIEKNRAGKWIALSSENLKNALIALMELSFDTRLQLGENGRKLMEDNYSIESVAKLHRDVYMWLLGKGNRPSCIV